jgi:hypothetical protein
LATFDPLPFDTDAARAYGRVFSAVMATGRKAGVPEPSTCSSPQPHLPPAFRSTPAAATTSWRSMVSSK